ncbi:AraC family transcriptional regulator [Herbiconiux liangxiaofengii]|uniref:AraC family transcriptional regulator n=1 Tax=Herbiconiux liangxiaofengii TaxID=3342795 RepID=UPI0035B79576
MSTLTSPLGTPTAEAGGSSAMRRYERGGTDPGEAASVYQTAYTGQRFTVTPDDDDFSYRYASLGDDRLTLRTSVCSGSVAGEVPYLQQYVVSWFKLGGGVLNLRQFERRGTDSTPFLFPSEQQFALSFAAHRQNLIHLDQTFLEDVATELHAGPPQAVSFDLEAEPDHGMLANWRGAVSAVTAAVLDTASTSLMRMNAELQVARALLQLFPWRALDVPAVLRAPSAAKARVALEFMQHHAHDPITPADAARAAGVHTRTLQQATRRHLGLSPSMYLRNVRLDRVHEQLRLADPGSTTVASVAREWGFGNLGRFSSAYTGRFGQKPSRTLRL